VTIANRPAVKGLAAIVDGAGMVLVQCDVEESFYRLPGGCVELGESAGAAIVRELAEEYAVPVTPGRLLAVIENRFAEGDRPRHEIVLVHLASIDASYGSRRAAIAHLEHDRIQLVWRDLVHLKAGLVPKGLHKILQSPASHPVHLIVP
jgi:ADP-ribose pyrophosphatase YjhB (NUDIX family)